MRWLVIFVVGLSACGAKKKAKRGTPPTPKPKPLPFKIKSRFYIGQTIHQLRKAFPNARLAVDGKEELLPELRRTVHFDEKLTHVLTAA